MVCMCPVVYRRDALQALLASRPRLGVPAGVPAPGWPVVLVWGSAESTAAYPACHCIPAPVQ